MNLVNTLISAAFLVSVLRGITPYFLGASAANFSERGGVINIAIEGFMTLAAFTFAVTMSFTGNAALSIFTALFINVAFSLLYSVFTVKLKIDQIVTGVGFNLFIEGITKFLLMYFFHSSSNTERIEDIPLIPGLKSIPLFGEFFGDSIILFAYLLMPLSFFILNRTRFGLRLRSAGENPKAGESLGIKIRSYRVYGIMISGLLSALAGIWLAGEQNSYSDFMIAGRGYIAIAAMIIGKWKPVNIFIACLMFAFFEALQIAIQTSGTGFPTQFIQMLPYLITVLVLIGFIGKTKPPAADGVPY